MTESPGPHPVRQLTETLGRVPRYLALARSLISDPSIPRWRKAALLAGLAYLASPIDLVPGLIPVAGQLDDLAAALLGLRTALRGTSRATAAEHLRTAGLEAGDIARDLSIVRGTAGWLARGVARTGAKAARAGVRAGAKVATGVGRTALVGLRGAGRAVQATRSGARPSGDRS